jgi:1-deoxy-D-xylulose-5-phosphate synthase
MTAILENAICPTDIMKLPQGRLPELATEIRRRIIDTVSTNGGHLASNLGVVELTIAILREFDPLATPIVWDVGHQCYAYKLLTGRCRDFATLRTMGGVSGFPKREESPYDAFNTGHSSTSISVALGMARAARIQGRPDHAIAVIGDGALSGGVALEALNDGGQSGENLLVILNDNQMSINRNVGSLSKHLENIRVSPRYRRLKSRMDAALKRIPLVGRPVARLAELAKRAARHLIRSRKVVFEDFGYQYYGPVDGHSFEELGRHLGAVRDMKGPVLLHVITQKGRGYEYAELSPDVYHGVAPFEIENGIGSKNGSAPPDGKATFSDAFGSALLDIADSHPEVVAVSAAMRIGTGLDRFAERHPDRFFDVGIAEQHALSMAAGMAAVGLVPVVAIYSTFLQRAYDQVLHDIALQKLHLVLTIDRAGIVGEDGETHQGLYDIAFLTTIPGIEILAPSDYGELRTMLTYAVETAHGPVAIRYPRGKGREDLASASTVSEPTTIGRPRRLMQGEGITVVSVGTMAERVLEVARSLASEGIACDVLDVRWVKPFDREFLFESVRRTGAVLIAEDGTEAGGFGQTFLAALQESGIQAVSARIACGDHPLTQGTREQLFRQEGMDVDSIASALRRLWKAKTFRPRDGV